MVECSGGSFSWEELCKTRCRNDVRSGRRDDLALEVVHTGVDGRSLVGDVGREESDQSLHGQLDVDADEVIMDGCAENADEPRGRPASLLRLSSRRVRRTTPHTPTPQLTTPPRATLPASLRTMGRPRLVVASALALRGGTMAEEICSFSPNPLTLFQSCIEVIPPPPLISSTTIGVLLACLAATMNAAGLNLQRWASARGLAALNLVGVVMSASCGLLDMASFSFAPQSLLAPFGALTLVLNLLVAAPLHGDAVSKSDLLSTFLVVSGVATCLANANTDATERTFDELKALIYRPHFHAWVTFLLAAMATAAARLRSAGGAMCYPLIAGGLGGCTTLCAKSVGELGKAGAPWHVATGVGALIPMFALSQLGMLNRGLSKASSLVVVPVFVATFVTCNAVGGGIFFDEFATLSPSQQRAYPLGLAMLVAGVLVLAGRKEEVVKAE